MPKDKTLIYPPGSVLTFTTGDYSDFSVRGFLVTVKDCNLPALAQAYTNGKQEWDSDGQPESFPSWLIATGHAMPVDHAQIHLGSYGTWEPEFGVQLAPPSWGSDASDMDKIEDPT